MSWSTPIPPGRRPIDPGDWEGQNVTCVGRVLKSPLDEFPKCPYLFCMLPVRSRRLRWCCDGLKNSRCIEQYDMLAILISEVEG